MSLVRAERLGKTYRIGPSTGGATRLTERLSRWTLRPAPAESVEALDDVSFEVAAGEVLGVIGANGAGKSTLLKILARVTDPTRGRAIVEGRLGSLLEVGTGFHPELSGRENVWLSGAILGMTRSEVRRSFDDIVEFSGIGRFLDTPVKRYSSGMYVRLGFAVAAHLRTEVLLIDEVLAVGDVAFQRRCLDTMRDVTSDGRAVIFVSHDLGAVRALCDRAMLLERGRQAACGSVDATVERYLCSSMAEGSSTAQFEADPERAIDITAVALVSADGRQAPPTVGTTDDLAIRIDYVVRRPVSGTNLVLTIRRNGVPVFTTFDTDADPDRTRRSPGSYETVVLLPTRHLKAGRIGVNVGAEFTNIETIVNHTEAIGFDLVETREGIQHKSYLSSRTGELAMELAWATRRRS